MKRAIIFGVTGQDGQFLADALLEEGFQVLGVSRYSLSERTFQLDRLNDSKHFTTTSLNLLDRKHVDSILQQFMPDYIFNLSGITSVAKSFRCPVDTFESIAVATQNILDSIRIINTKIRFLNAGSSECFGESVQNRRHTEDSNYNPQSPYATAKVAALHMTDMYRKCYNVRSYSAILSNHESILRKEYFATKKIVSTLKRVAQGKEPFLSLGNLDISRDFGWAPDYVQAMIKIIQSEVPDNYIVCTGQVNTLRSFVEKSCDFYGLDIKCHVRIDSSLFRSTDPRTIALSPEKINKIIGWKARVTYDDVVKKLCRDELF